MAKKKKKTIASTRKMEKEEGAEEQVRKETKKGLKKLFAKSDRRKAEKEKEREEKIAERAAAREAKKAEKELEKARAAKQESEEEILKSFEDATKETVEKAHKNGKGKTERKRFQISPERRQKIRGGLLTLIGIFALSFIGYFLFGKMFRPEYLAEILPGEKTVGVIEINIDGANSQPQLFFEALKNHPAYSRQGVTSLLNTAFPVDYKTELEPWLARRAGIGFYEVTSKDGSTKTAPIIFLESREHNLTLEALKNRALNAVDEEVVATEYQGRKLYEYQVSQSLNFTFINNYLVLTDSKETLMALADDMAAGKPKLADDPTYQKVANNLPQGGLVFAYVDLRKLFEALEKDKVFVAQKGQDMLAFKPFLDMFSAEGMTIFAEKDRFVGQTFSAINRDALDGEDFLTYNEKYQGELLAMANEDPIFLAGGHDLTKELNRLEDVFKSGTKTPALIFDGMLEAQKQRYFGRDISLKDDIYPLLKGEYLLTAENNFEKPVVTLYLQLADPANDPARVEKLINAFVQVSGVFSPRVQDVTLPDGTSGKEIVASPEKVERTSAKYADKNIEVLKLGETGVSINYVQMDNVAVFSTSQDQLKRIMDRKEGKVETGLNSGKYYAKSIYPVLRTADEVLHLKVGALTDILSLSTDSPFTPYLLPFTNLTVTKNFFEDGISTIYIVDVI
ncbi:MAG TPA: DUF3352 domain-containing protein [Candidatus Gracilibacteria bacterium]|nr:DUF3352 domain-containing protein [Candidatus Gracilibacteria bacterium]